MVKKLPKEDDEPFRPSLDAVRDSECASDAVLNVMVEAWDETPEIRPDFRTIRNRLKGMKEGR